jgi:hypothetical protein
VSAIEHAKPGSTELRTLAAYVEALGGRLEITADGYRVRVVQNPTLSLAGDAAAAKLIIDAIAPDAVRADLLGVVQRFLEPTHDAPWIRQTR